MWRRCLSAGPRRSTRWRRALRWPTMGTLIRSTWATLPPARPTAAPVFGHRSCSSCLRCVEATLTLPWPYRIWAWEYACSFMRKWACMRLRTCVTVWVCRREVSVRSWSIAIITTINTAHYYYYYLLLPPITTTTTTTPTITIIYYYHLSLLLPPPIQLLLLHTQQLYPFPPFLSGPEPCITCRWSWRAQPAWTQRRIRYLQQG